MRWRLATAAGAAACILCVGTGACAQEARRFDIPAGPLAEALTAFATQSDRQILFAGDLLAGRRSAGLSGVYTPEAALQRLLAGSGLEAVQTRPGVFLVRAAEAAAGPVEVAVEDVVITGTLLRSGDPASPVTVLDRAALERRGLGTVAEALTDLPQNYAGSGTPIVQMTSADRQGSNAVYATGVNLRGLGPASTLTLVNGRRMAGTGFRGEFGDVSALPSAAVERVDVLLDGASALYGADAVAGVVNVVMRRRFEGHESGLRVSAARGGAEDLIVSHLAGTDWGSGSAYLSYEQQESGALSSLDRSYTADGDLRPFGGRDRRNLFSAPGNILAYDAAVGGFVSRYAIRPGASGTAQGPADFAAGEANLQSLSLGMDLLPDLRRRSVYGRVRQDLGERIEVSGDLRYSRRSYDFAGAPSIGVLTVTAANPFFVSPDGSASHLVGYAFSDLGAPRQSGESESFGLTAGGTLDLDGGWRLDGYLAVARERGEAAVEGRVHSRFLNEALGTTPDDPTTDYQAARDGWFNPFGRGDANGPEVLAFIGSGYSRARDRSRAESVNLLAEGPLWALPAGDLRLAAGVQLRREAFETRSTAFLSTPAPVVTAAPEAERTVEAVFAEARVPLAGGEGGRPGLRALDLSLAVRHERYDDFGSTTNPKVGLVWSPAEGLTVRGSWGSSFRAASLPQTRDAEATSVTFVPRADGSQVLSLYLYGGNADLQPETAETFTLGVDWRGAGGLGLSLGYFDTDFTDRIAQPVTENLSGALTDPALAPFVTLVDPGADADDLALVQSYIDRPDFAFAGVYPATSYGAILDGRWVNTGAVRVRGVDLAARYPVSLGDHRLTFETTASWILGYDSRATPTATSRDMVGVVGYPVRLRARSGATWTRAELSAGLHWNHVAAYEDREGTPIDAWNTFDAQLGWSPESGPAKGLRVALTVHNLLDEDPPFHDAPSGFGFDPGQASLLGRTVSLQLTRRW